MIPLASVILTSLVPMGVAIYFVVRHYRRASTTAARTLVGGVAGFNIVLALLILGFGAVWLSSPPRAMAAGAPNQVVGGSPSVVTLNQATQAAPDQALADAISTGLAAIGAGLSVGGAAIGAGVAVGGTGAAAVGTIAEKPETLGRSLIFVGLAEGIAIYGLIISFLVLYR
jgi:F0F1-type ATP synthase membrane subunit c/vacuolar-type H+-ATPase subunit K